MEQFAKSLGIIKKGKIEDGKYVITLVDSDAYAKMFESIDSSNLVTHDPENVSVNGDETNLVYYSDRFKVELKSDFNNDKYSITISQFIDPKEEEKK